MAIIPNPTKYQCPNCYSLYTAVIAWIKPEIKLQMRKCLRCGQQFETML